MKRTTSWQRKSSILLGLALSIQICCNMAPEKYGHSIDQTATDYVRLALGIAQYDDAFVDAYYGPDSLQPTGKPLDLFPKDSLLRETQRIAEICAEIGAASPDSTTRQRALWIGDQLKAFDRRIRIFSGEEGSFDEESLDLFGVVAPSFPESHFIALISRLDQMLPGAGSVPERFQALANRFIIPKDKLDTVFHTAIAACRNRTLQYYQLPESEDFQLEFVNNKSWNGYNWYQGNYKSLIQINTDLDIFIDRAIDVGSHESYPGHHVYNVLLEKHLYRDKGFIEISVYPLYSPQSLIAEGSANYGIDVVLPGNEKAKFAADVLLPLAGLDTNGIATYFQALEVRNALNYARNEVARGLLDGTMSLEEALRWLREYALYNAATAEKSISFIRNYRTYVMNYNYGQDLVKSWTESRGGTADQPERRWQLFGDLLSREVRIGELQ